MKIKNKILQAILFYLKEQRTINIVNLLNKKKIYISILGYGITGESFLKWALSNLSLLNIYFVFDKNYKTITIKDNIYFFPEDYKNKYLKKSHFIFSSPGILIRKNKNWYKKIIPELDLFFYLWNKKNYESIIITGSIGKTSLAVMIDHYLGKLKNTILCGNIGFPVLNFINNINDNKKKLAIIECSNLQLEHCRLIKPNYFIISNLFQNHLNMHNSYRDYIYAKLTPIIYQLLYIKKIIITENVYKELAFYFPVLLNKIMTKIVILINNNDLKNYKKLFSEIITLKNNIIFSKSKILLNNIPSFSFVTNWQILATILNYYIDDPSKFIINNNFPSLPKFRLEKIFDNKSIIIFNDSKSTIINSSIAALNQILLKYNNYNIFFMIGGLSKGVDRSFGIEEIGKKVYQIIFFGDESKTLFNNFNKKYNNSISFSSLKEAIIYSLNVIKKYNNNIIIFSPGGSSFDEFKSYIDRGKYFSEMIEYLLLK